MVKVTLKGRFGAVCVLLLLTMFVRSGCEEPHVFHWRVPVVRTFALANLQRFLRGLVQGSDLVMQGSDDAFRMYAPQKYITFGLFNATDQG